MEKLLENDGVLEASESARDDGAGASDAAPTHTSERALPPGVLSLIHI